MTSVSQPEPPVARSQQSTYLQCILREAPRVMSMMDRQPKSPTAGCCDRTYWAWKFVDFPRPRFQEALCVMAFLHGTKAPDNPYFGASRLAQWITLGLAFWTRLQHRDGSFDEAYPFERSLAATAFTTFYLAEALYLAGDIVSPETRSQVLRTMRKAGIWLLRNDETHGFLSNHISAAAAALLHVHRLTGERRFAARAEKFLERILAAQSEEGWYPEYEGADPGYQSHGALYLARCWEMTGDRRLHDSLRRSSRFLAHFVHPDCSFGGEYASRNTQTFYPAAFEILADTDPNSAWILMQMRPSVETGSAAGLRCIDMFNYFPCLNNLALAYLACKRREANGLTPPSDPTPRKGLSWFPKAGIARVRTARYDAFVGAQKGGVLKVFDRRRRRLVYSDSGYLGRCRNGALASTQHTEKVVVEVCSERVVRLRCPVVAFRRPTFSPLSFVLFRVFMLTAGRVPFLASLVKRSLVGVLIRKSTPMRITLRRTISFESDRVEVEDYLQGDDAYRLLDLSWEERFTTIHMGSSAYFVPHELHDDFSSSGSERRVNLQRLPHGVRLVRSVDLS